MGRKELNHRISRKTMIGVFGRYFDRECRVHPGPDC